jgi:hypothetical protein
MDRNTLNTWDCIAEILSALKRELQFKYTKKVDETYKKYKIIEDFFLDVVLDFNRKYGVERFEAFNKLVIMESPKMISVADKLFLNVEPNRKIRFSPNQILKVNEYNLFKELLKTVILYFLINAPVQAREFLFKLYKDRKKKFGEKDKIVQDLIGYMKLIRGFGTDYKILYTPYIEKGGPLFHFIKTSPKYTDPSK